VRHRPSRPAPQARPDEVLHCRHFGTCGSCSLLDQPIQWQLHDKVDACERLLAPFLGGARIASEAPARAPRHFRTRLLYPVHADRDGLPIAGMYAFRTHELVRIEQCQTIDDWLVGFGRAAEGAMRELRLTPFDRRRRRGSVLALWARLASGTGQVLAGVVTRPGVFAEGPALAAALLDAQKRVPPARQARELVGVVHSISDRDEEFLLGDRHVPLRGSDHVNDRSGGLTFRISAGSFYQVHADADRLLYRPALAMCGDVRGLTVVDGYGGVGCFGLRFASAGAARVTIVEENPAACRDAGHNAASNGLANVAVVQAPFAGASLPRRADLMVLDPPRSGLQGKAMARVLAAAPQRILYVACSADSLARDLAELTREYRLAAARLCDLFPHTEHVEVVAMLERTAPAGS
jgi:23S rRNA (uracil-5-)-methyltransferase RumA